MKKITVLLTSLLFVSSLFLLPAHVSATTFRQGENVTLKAGDQISGNLYAAGQEVIIDGTLDGDLFCGAETVRINGQVNGDVICGAKTIAINGIVQGNIRVAAQDVVVTGQVQRNANILSQTVIVKPSGKINGELDAASQTLTLEGVVNRDIAIAVEDFHLNGVVGNSALVSAEKFNFGKAGKINGDFTYHSDTEIKPPAGVIAGNVKYLQVKPERDPDRQNTFGDVISGTLASILGALLMGLALVWVFPHSVSQVMLQMQANPGRTILWGILFSIIVPILAIILLFTFVGIGAALVLAAFYAIALLVSRVFAAIVVGKMLVEKYSPKHKNDMFWEVLAGVVVSWLAFSLPLLGGMLSLLAFWWGMGGIFQALHLQRHGDTKSS